MSPSFTYTAQPSHVIFGLASFDRWAEEIERLGRERVLILATPRLADLVARARELLGAVRMGRHHKLCHTLGGSFDLPHAETHTVLLPHALADNAGHAPEAVAQIASALDTDDPAGAIYDLAQRSTGSAAQEST